MVGTPGAYLNVMTLFLGYGGVNSIESSQLPPDSPYPGLRSAPRIGESYGPAVWILCSLRVHADSFRYDWLHETTGCSRPDLVSKVNRPYQEGRLFVAARLVPAPVDLPLPEGRFSAGYS